MVGTLESDGNPEKYCFSSLEKSRLFDVLWVLEHSWKKELSRTRRCVQRLQYLQAAAFIAVETLLSSHAQIMLPFQGWKNNSYLKTTIWSQSDHHPDEEQVYASIYWY